MRFNDSSGQDSGAGLARKGSEGKSVFPTICRCNGNKTRNGARAWISSWERVRWALLSPGVLGKAQAKTGRMCAACLSYLFLSICAGSLFCLESISVYILLATMCTPRGLLSSSKDIPVGVWRVHEKTRSLKLHISVLIGNFTIRKKKVSRNRRLRYHFLRSRTACQ